MHSPSTLVKLFINGEWVTGKSGRTFAVVNPTTEEKIVDVHEAEAGDVDLAVNAAENSFTAWREVPLSDRIALCYKFADLVERDRHELARIEANNMGMPVSVCHEYISGAIADIKTMAGLANDVHGETSLNSSGLVSFTLKQPFGVCAAIIPWNVPIIMWCGAVIPCVVAGNTMVLKSSEKAPLTSLKLAALSAEAGFPAGVINSLSGFGHIAGAAMASHMRIRKISFTGSTRTGKLIMESAAKSNMKRVSAECGGKNPVAIFDDADLEAAVESVTASIHNNSGQICVSNSRVYVHQVVFAQFLDLFTKSFTNVKAGNPLDESTTFGPQVDKAQFDNILSMIDEAKAEGANLVTGGTRGRDKGYFIKPTIFVRVPKKAQILQTEVFGPVIAIQEFKTEEEVIAECNDTEYGLHATVFTRDISRAYRMVKAFEAGNVTVNCGSEQGPYDLPFGGWKQSGLGTSGGKHALEAFYELKTVSIKL